VAHGARPLPVLPCRTNAGSTAARLSRHWRCLSRVPWHCCWPACRWSGWPCGAGGGRAVP